MKRFAATLIVALTFTTQLLAQPRPVPPNQPQQAFPFPTVLVTGRGEVSAKPDRAVVRLGAMAQDEKAAAAQQRVNQLLQQILEKIKGAGVPEERIQTVGLTLNPVYEQQAQRPGHLMPPIIGYQAANTVQVQLDDLTQIGAVIDAALAAGANHLEGVSFELKDDAARRRDALRKAVADAKEKARAIAEAAGHNLGDIVEITEGGLDIVRPLMMHRDMAMGAEATPIQPGEIRVEATVSIRYALR